MPPPYPTVGQKARMYAGEITVIIKSLNVDKY
jgi:hypothetical protein